MAKIIARRGQAVMVNKKNAVNTASQKYNKGKKPIAAKRGKKVFLDKQIYSLKKKK